jgi:VCBS repeat-containing protein
VAFPHSSAIMRHTSFRLAWLWLSLLLLPFSLAKANVKIRIVAGNLSSGNNQSYDNGEGSRILQGLKPDIALVQEFNYASDTAANFRSWVDTYFGTSFSYYREPTSSSGDIPNGIISRYPILSSGFWDDSTMTNREYAWAKIDIPGDKDLWVISVHIKASSGSTNASQRNTEAGEIVSYINANIPSTDYVAIGGDFNTYSRTEACISTLSSVFVTASPFPSDQSGNSNTNAGRSSPYDWVMADTDLDKLEVPVVIGSNSFTSGLVFDSRVYTPLTDVSPVVSTDSGATNMQHMAVVRDFSIPSNNPPVISQGSSTAKTISEDGSPTAFALTLNATDADGNTMTWQVSTTASHGTAGVSSTSNGQTATVTYVPTANYNGTDTFTLTVSDGNGGTATHVVNVTISAVNDAPVITQGASTAKTISEDGSPTAFSLTLNATDADSDAMTWQVSTVASHGTAGVSSTSNGQTATVTYVPTANYNGTDTFTLTVSDGNGGTATHVVSVTITAVNDAPVITQGASTAKTISEDGSPTAFALTLNATDVDGDTMTWQVSTTASHGTAGVSSASNGQTATVTYVPTANYNGTDTFTLTVSDGKGGTATHVVNVMITEVNDAPVITQGASTAKTISEDGSPTAFALILNATDVDGDTMTWQVSTTASHGTAGVSSASNGQTVTVTYVPTPNYNGTDTFTLTVSDGKGGSVSHLVNVTINAVNDSPVIQQGASSSQNIMENSSAMSVSFSLNASDVDGDSLTWQITSAASHGSVGLLSGSNGQTLAVSYGPHLDYVGTDAFTLTVSDGNGGTATHAVAITVLPTGAYDAWVSSTFSSLDQQTRDTLWGPDADPDGDGASNLTEYAQGTDPFVKDSATNLIQCKMAQVGGFVFPELVIRERMSGGVAALNYSVQQSQNLNPPWTEIGGYTVMEESTAGDFRISTYRLSQPATEVAKLFFRLSYTR